MIVIPLCAASGRYSVSIATTPIARDTHALLLVAEDHAAADFGGGDRIRSNKAWQ
jgi:hypothetical protein